MCDGLEGATSKAEVEEIATAMDLSMVNADDAEDHTHIHSQ